MPNSARGLSGSKAKPLTLPIWSKPRKTSEPGFPTSGISTSPVTLPPKKSAIPGTPTFTLARAVAST